MFHYVAFFVAGLARVRLVATFRSLVTLSGLITSREHERPLVNRGSKIVGFQCFLGDIENGVFSKTQAGLGRIAF